MSLINEALKKAQHVRTGETVGTMAPLPGGGSRVAKHSAPRTAQPLVLITAGAIVLIVLSVVATVFLVNRPADPQPSVAATPKAAASPPAATPPASSSVIVVQMGAPPPASPHTVIPTPPGHSQPPAATATTTTAATPSATVPAPAPSLAAATATAERSAPAPLPVAPSPPKLEERAILFVDAIKVAGVRAFGNESRVLINDRVFRLNEIVERTFGLRLSKVEVNALTFTDANGAVYVKRF